MIAFPPDAETLPRGRCPISPGRPRDTQCASAQGECTAMKILGLAAGRGRYCVDRASPTNHRSPPKLPPLDTAYAFVPLPVPPVIDQATSSSHARACLGRSPLVPSEGGLREKPAIMAPIGPSAEHEVGEYPAQDLPDLGWQSKRLYR
eukprot:9494745-Pyramimonas_sp.AAC.1